MYCVAMVQVLLFDSVLNFTQKFCKCYLFAVDFVL